MHKTQNTINKHATVTTVVLHTTVLERNICDLFSCLFVVQSHTITMRRVNKIDNKKSRLSSYLNYFCIWINNGSLFMFTKKVFDPIV